MEYKIEGGNFPIVICTLKKGETMKTEGGGMAMMSPHMKMETNTDGGLIKGLGRALSGESLFFNFYTAEQDDEFIGFASSFPGRIIPIEITPNKSIIAQKTAFLSSEESVDIKIHLKKKLSTGIFGGEGFILQKFEGNGMVFLEMDGAILEYDLKEGEQMIIDQGHLGAMEETVTFDIEKVKGAKNILLGGEGLYLGKLTGPGKVWVQTMPLNNLINVLLPHLQTGS